jgi:hypothetical protein
MTLERNHRELFAFSSTAVGGDSSSLSSYLVRSAVCCVLIRKPFEREGQEESGGKIAAPRQVSGTMERQVWIHYLHRHRLTSLRFNLWDFESGQTESKSSFPLSSTHLSAPWTRHRRPDPAASANQAQGRRRIAPDAPLSSDPSLFLPSSSSKCSILRFESRDWAWNRKGENQATVGRFWSRHSTHTIKHCIKIGVLSLPYRLEEPQQACGQRSSEPIGRRNFSWACSIHVLRPAGFALD